MPPGAGCWSCRPVRSSRSRRRVSPTSGLCYRPAGLDAEIAPGGNGPETDFAIDHDWATRIVREKGRQCVDFVGAHPKFHKTCGKNVTLSSCNGHAAAQRAAPTDGPALVPEWCLPRAKRALLHCVTWGAPIEWLPHENHPPPPSFPELLPLSPWWVRRRLPRA